MQFISVIVFLLIACAIGHGNVLRQQKEGQAVYDSLPEEEKHPFLSFHLIRGMSDGQNVNFLRAGSYDCPQPPLSDDLVRKFSELEVPANFSEELVLWVQDDFGVAEEDIPRVARGEQVCFEDGHCVDIGDVGGNCCPL